MSDLQETTNWVWVLCAGGLFPCGVFETREQAEQWILRNKVNEGCLTKYPLGEGLYDFAMRKGYFTPKKEHQFTPKFISTFSCASLEHYHYEFDEITGELDIS